MPGSPRSCSQIHSRYGSSFDTADARTYFGGASAANALRIVLRCSPVRLLISRIDNRSTRCIRLTSAHCSTPTTPSSSPDHSNQTRVQTRPDEPDPTPDGSLLDRRRWTTIHPAPTAAADSAGLGFAPGWDLKFMSRTRLSVAAAALVSVALWASAFVGIRAAGREFGPGQLAAGRLLIGCVV